MQQVRNINDLSRREIENLIDEWIHNARNRRILRRRLIDGVRFEPLAEEFDLSVTQVKNIVYNARRRLAQHIK